MHLRFIDLSQALMKTNLVITNNFFVIIVMLQNMSNEKTNNEFVYVFFFLETVSPYMYK